jgi:hypothetical protein
MYSEGWEAIQWESYLCILEDLLCLQSYYSILNYIEQYHACIYNNNIIIEESNYFLLL